MSHPALDALIDDVAARLTSGEPGPNLRAGVLARLDREPGRRRRVLTIAAAAGALTAAIVLAVAIRSLASFVPPDVSTVPARPVSILAAAPLPVVGLVTPPPPRHAGSRRTGSPVLSADEAAWMRRAIPTLADRPPIAIDGIQPDPLGTALLEVTPLATAPLAVAPIDGGGRVPPRRP